MLHQTARRHLRLMSSRMLSQTKEQELIMTLQAGVNKHFILRQTSSNFYVF